MGRKMPTECEHGVVVDGGDFLASFVCEECEEEGKAFNDGHIIEGLDRSHTIMLMIGELLIDHPAVVKAGARGEIGKASEMMMDAYQKIGELL